MHTQEEMRYPTKLASENASKTSRFKQKKPEINKAMVEKTLHSDKREAENLQHPQMAKKQALFRI